jgi:hypothetical protein
VVGYLGYCEVFFASLKDMKCTELSNISDVSFGGRFHNMEFSVL